MPRGERMLASGLGVYRFVTIGEISREQNQLVRPYPAAKRRGGIKTIARPITLGLCFCAVLSFCGAGFHANRSVLHDAPCSFLKSLICS